MVYCAESYDEPYDMFRTGPTFDVTRLSHSDPTVVLQMLNKLQGVNIENLVSVSEGEVTAPAHTLTVRMGRNAVTRVIEFDQE